MITANLASTLHYNQTLYHRTLRNADGTPMRCRVTGMCKRWTTRPDDFRLPVKHGMYDSFYITPANGHEWHLTEQAAIAAGKEKAIA